MPPRVRLCLSYSLPALGLCGIGGPDDYLDFSKHHHDVRYGSLADLFANISPMSGFERKADVGSRVSQSGSTISTRCIPGPQPSVVVEAVLAPNLAKKGADFWLAAILTIFASDVRPK